MAFGWTPFDQVMAVVAAVSLAIAVWAYFYTHPRKKQK